MQSTPRRIFSVFTLVCVLLGVVGINVTGAASKLTAPSAPYSPKVSLSLTKATVTWMPPKSNGGKGITSFTVTAYPGKKTQLCKASGCIMMMVNPNKPSSKPVGVIFYVTVIATNSIGSSAESERSGTFSVTFYPSTYIPPKSGPATPWPTNTPTPAQTGIAKFDGSYQGHVVLNVSLPSLNGGTSTNTYPVSFTLVNGRGTGGGQGWTFVGDITDASGIASVTGSSSIYGSITFAVNFAYDSTTNAMAGNGKGTQDITMQGYGTVNMNFVFSVSRS